MTKKTKEELIPSSQKQLKGGDENHTWEEKKRAAYAAMGKLGGLARAKQMAEKGFIIKDKAKNVQKKNTSKEEKKKI